MLRVCSVFCAAVAASFFLSPSAVIAGQPGIEAFGSLPFGEEPTLAPDGNHFAMIQSLHGRPAAVIYDVNAALGTMPKVISDQEAIIVGIHWAKSDRLLMTVNMNQKAGGDTKVQSWYRTIGVDPDGKNMTVLFANSAWRDLNYSNSEVVDYDLDDPTHVYMPLWVPGIDDAFTLNLYRVDVKTGDAERFASGRKDTNEWIMDGHGHIVARIDQTQHPLTDHLRILVKDDWNEIGSYEATGGHDSGILGVTEDGTGLAQRSIIDKTGMTVLGRLDIASGKESGLFATETYDVDHSLHDPWTGRIIGAAFTDDKEEYVYFDPAMEKLQRGLEVAFPGLSVHAVSWNLAKDKLIVVVDGPRQPVAYYYLNRTTHEATQLASTYPNLDEADLGEMKPWPYKARDGLDIPAYLTLPPGKAPKNLPVVIMPHGGPGARDALGFDWMAQFFANRGYAVLQPNFRGSTGYGTKFEEAGYGEWGLKMQDDVTDGVKKLIADGIADPKRICIVGASYGGYAALAGAAFTPDLYACAVSFAGVSDLGKFLRTRASDYGSDSWMISTWTRYIGNRYDDSDKLAATSPAENAAKIKCPVLLFHGAGDTTVRIDQSEEMRDALQKAGKQVEFVRFDADSHYMLLADTRTRFLKETEAFLKKNIGE